MELRLRIESGTYTFNDYLKIADSDGGNADGKVTMVGGKIVATNGIQIGANNGYTGTFEYQGGEIGADVKIGSASGSTGIFNVLDGAKFTNAVGKKICVSEANGATGIFNVLEGGAVELDGKFLVASKDKYGSAESHYIGKATVYTNGTLTAAGIAISKGQYSEGTLTIDGGTVTTTQMLEMAQEGSYDGNCATARLYVKNGGKLYVTGGESDRYVHMGQQAGGDSLLRVEGEGSCVEIGGHIWLSRGGATTGAVEVAGGTFAAGKLEFGSNWGNAGAFYTQTGGEATFSDVFQLSGNTANNQGIVTLSGGTLALKGFTFAGADDNAYTILFDGTTVKPYETYNSAFLPADSRLTVKVAEGGAIFDTDGKNLTIGAAMTNDDGVDSASLVKKGTGTLTLTNENLFSGTVTVAKKGGTVVVPNTASISAGANTKREADGDTYEFSYDAPQYTVTVPSVEHTIVTVTADGVEVVGVNGVYTVNEDADVVVTYSRDGYYILSGTTVFEFDAISENKTIAEGDAPTATAVDPFCEIEKGEYILIGNSDRSFKDYVLTRGTLSVDDDSGLKIGSTRNGAGFTVSLYNETAGDFILSMLGGASGLTATYNISVTNASGYSESAIVTQQDTSSWTPSQMTLLKLPSLPAGLLTLTFDITSTTGSYAGNYGYIRIDTLADGTITPPTPDGGYVNLYKSAFAVGGGNIESDRQIGSTGNGTTLSFILDIDSTAQYGVGYLYGSQNNTATLSWSLCNSVGIKLADLGEADDIEITGSWTITETKSHDFGTLGKGIYVLQAKIASSGTAGNYGAFNFTKTAVTTYTIAVPQIEHATASVTVGGVPLEKENDEYVVAAGSDVVVTYTPDDGYYFADGATFEFDDVSANITEGSYGTLPSARTNPTVAIPSRDNALCTVYADGTAIGTSGGEYSVQPGTVVTVSYRGDASGTPYGMRDYDLGAISVDTALAENSVPLYFKDETVTTNLVGNVDVVLYASYNTDLTLNCDWSELTGLVLAEGNSGYIRFGADYVGSAGAKWVVDEGLYLDATEGTVSMKSIVFSGRKRISMLNGTQNVTLQLGGDEDFVCAANSGIGAHHWHATPNANAGVAVEKTGTCKMTSNLAGARRWIVSAGEVEFVPLTEIETQENGTMEVYVNTCTNMTVKNGATISGFYGPLPDSDVAANYPGKYGIEALVLESGSTFKPTVGRTWKVKTLSLDGATIAPETVDGLVNGETYTLIEAEDGITGSFTSSGDFTVTRDGNKLVATYTGTGAKVIANGETFTYSRTTAAQAAHGIIVENGGRLVVDMTAVDFDNGTCSLPHVEFAEGADIANSVSVVKPSGMGAVYFVMSDGYGTITVKPEKKAGLVIVFM